MSSETADVPDFIADRNRQDWLGLIQTVALLTGVLALGAGLALLLAMNLVNATFASYSPVAPGVDKATSVIDTLYRLTQYSFGVFVVGALTGVGIDMVVDWDE